MTESTPQSFSDLLRNTVTSRVEMLQRGALANESAAVRQLAELRRCNPASPGTNPEVWQLTLGDLPERLSGRGDDPSSSEYAIHAALTLFALHQQSHVDPTHRRGVRLGQAVGALARARSDGGLNESVLRHFHRVALASEYAQRIHHLRGLIVLMRGESPTIGLDYGLLALDLAQLARPDYDLTAVLTRWGRDIHSRRATPVPTTSDVPTPQGDLA